MIKYDCYGFCGSSRKIWQGFISKLVYSGSHLEISVMLAQPVTAFVCKTTAGYFVYFTHLECGVNLDSLFLVEENYGRLAAIFDDKDAYSVAFAICKVGNLLSNPRKKSKAVNNQMQDLPF